MKTNRLDSRALLAGLGAGAVFAAAASALARHIVASYGTAPSAAPGYALFLAAAAFFGPYAAWLAWSVQHAAREACGTPYKILHALAYASAMPAGAGILFLALP